MTTDILYFYVSYCGKRALNSDFEAVSIFSLPAAPYYHSKKNSLAITEA